MPEWIITYLLKLMTSRIPKTEMKILARKRVLELCQPWVLPMRSTLNEENFCFSNIQKFRSLIEIFCFGRLGVRCSGSPQFEGIWELESPAKMYAINVRRQFPCPAGYPLGRFLFNSIPSPLAWQLIVLISMLPAIVPSV